MTSVFFYHNARDKWGTVCQLLGKAVAQGKTVCVFSRSLSDLEYLDQMLWSFDPLSFVPHCWADSPLASQTPIILSADLSQFAQATRIFNLDESALSELSGDVSVIEVVGIEDADRLPARVRFKAYKQLGYTVQAIDLALPRAERSM